MALKVRPEEEKVAFRMESLDADLCKVGFLEEFLRRKYHDVGFEHVLGDDELQCERESIRLDGGGGFLMRTTYRAFLYLSFMLAYCVGVWPARIIVVFELGKEGR